MHDGRAHAGAGFGPAWVRPRTAERRSEIGDGRDRAEARHRRDLPEGSAEGSAERHAFGLPPHPAPPRVVGAEQERAATRADAREPALERKPRERPPQRAARRTGRDGARKTQSATAPRSPSRPCPLQPQQLERSATRRSDVWSRWGADAPPRGGRALTPGERGRGRRRSTGESGARADESPRDEQSDDPALARRGAPTRREQFKGSRARASTRGGHAGRGARARPRGASHARRRTRGAEPASAPKSADQAARAHGRTGTTRSQDDG